MESSLQEKLHIALIMDGNGRWAKSRHLPRLAGHAAGASAVRKIVKAAPDLGITMLTLYAFSSDNWQRPRSEISYLMGLLRRYLRRETPSFLKSDIRFIVIGRRDRLPRDLVNSIEHTEQATRYGRRLTLRVALDYSARHAILEAAAALDGDDKLSDEALSKRLSGTDRVCNVDLLIRTSGEQRLSDFLLWECAYAEFYFTQCLWPDFAEAELAVALAEYRTRHRRFGALPKDDGPQRAALANLAG